MRSLMVLMLALLLAACQTVPPQSGFSAQQIATLQEQGFKPVGENWELGMPDRLLFASNEATLMPETVATIDRLSRILQGVGIQSALVEGHTDSVGSEAHNQELSLRRAAAIKAAMVGAGMPEAQFRTIGFGETDPIESNDTEAGRAQNRRVVIVVSPADAMISVSKP